MLQFNLSVLIAFFTLNTCSQNEKVFGFNGHPLTQSAYSDISSQFKILKDAKANMYRVDIPINGLGEPHNKEAFKKLALESNSHPSISILPMLSPHINLKIRDLNQQYQRGYDIGRNFFSKYGDVIEKFSSYIEIGNEIELKAIKGAEYSGQSIDHYNTDIIDQYASFYKGFIVAANSTGINKKVIVNIGYVHWGYLVYLEQLNFPYDVIGLHWYSNMGNLFSFKEKKINVLNTLAEKFDKKILVDEFNIYKGTLEFSAIPYHQKWFEENVAEIMTNPNVLGVVFYELLDQPDFAKKRLGGYYNPSESEYGFFSLDSKKDYYIKDDFKNYEFFSIGVQNYK